MSADRFVCSECNGTFKLDKRRPAGSNIRCPKCHAVNIQGEAAEEGLQSARRTKADPAGRSKRAMDDDDVPSKRSKRRGAKKPGNGMLLALVGGGAGLLIAVVVVLVLVLSSGGGSSPRADQGPQAKDGISKDGVSKDGGAKPGPKPAQELSITADQLLKEFDDIDATKDGFADEQKMDALERKYLNKWLIIDGFIFSILKDSPYPIRVKEGVGRRGKGRQYWLTCRFGPSDADKVMNMVPDQRLKFKGKFVGNRDPSGQVFVRGVRFEDCEVIEIGPPPTKS